jgi:hypothetical protein
MRLYQTDDVFGLNASSVFRGQIVP